MNKNYINITNNNSGFKKFSLISSDDVKDEKIYYPNSVFTVAFLNEEDTRRNIQLMIESLGITIFDENNRIKKVYIGVTNDEMTIIETLKDFLRIQKKNNNKFDIILLDNCKRIIEKKEFFIQNKHKFLFENAEKSKEQNLSSVLNIISNIAISRDIPEIEIKLFTYLLGSYFNSCEANNQFHPVISYKYLVSIFEKSTDFDRKIIIKSIDRLSKRGLVKLDAIDKKSDLRLIKFNFSSNKLQFGTLS